MLCVYYLKYEKSFVRLIKKKEELEKRENLASKGGKVLHGFGLGLDRESGDDSDGPTYIRYEEISQMV